MGYNMMMYGLGCITGPMIGAFLYYFGGYKCPLFSLGSVYFLMLVGMYPCAWKAMKKSADIY